MSDEPKTISASFDSLYQQYKRKFVSIALSYVRDQNIAEDIVTDSFIAYWERRETLELEGSPQAFILGIVKNKCLMVLRNQKTFERVCQDVYRFSLWEIKHNTAVLEDCDLTKQLFSSEVADIYRA